MAAAQKMTQGKKENKFPEGRSIKEVLIYLNEVTGRLKINIIFLMILQSVSSVVGILYAFALRDIVNSATAGNLHLFLSKILGFSVLIVIQLTLTAAGSLITTYTSNTLENRFKQRLLSTLMDKDYGSVSAVHTGEWMTRLNMDASAVSSSVLQWLPDMISTFVRLIGVVIAIAMMEPIFLILIIPGGIIYIFIPYLFRNIRQRMQIENREKTGKLRVFLQDALASLIIVRSYSVEKEVEKEADEQMSDIRRTRIKQNLFSTAYSTGFSLVTRCGYILVVLFCGWRILTGNMNFGTFTAVLQLVSQLRGPLSSIGSFVSRYYTLMVNIERLMEAEDMPKSDEEEPLPLNDINEFYSQKFKGLGFRDIKFSYPTPVKKREAKMPVVLNGLNADINKGDYVALVGQSGCGKSTFLKLLMCLYPLDAGERYITLAGPAESVPAESIPAGSISAESVSAISVPAGSMPAGFIQVDPGVYGMSGNFSDEDTEAVTESLTSKWRRLFAYVPQGDTFMSGTVREIIAFSDKDAMSDDARINAAIKAACADDFVYKMENGVDTQLGERGAGLSEGQLQRLSIARAIFSQRPILLLDECTSALDDDTERRLLSNLQAMTDRTVFIVTHRPAALDICDKIIRFTPDGSVTTEDKKITNG